MKKSKKASLARLAIGGGSTFLIAGVALLISSFPGDGETTFLLPGILLASSGITFIGLGADFLLKNRKNLA